MNFIKSVAIYQLFILQFAVTIAEVGSSEERQTDIFKQIQEGVISKANEFWTYIENFVCIICKNFKLEENTCKEKKIAIPVTVVFSVLVFSIICLICCKCCCKMSCCKKKENDESDVDCNQFMMGPDGQMYSQMYQGQMMQPQMIPAGMVYPQMYPGQMYYPQMYPGQMYYPQMLQQGMQQPEMQQLEVQQQEMQQLEVQQQEMQYMEMQQPETQHL